MEKQTIKLALTGLSSAPKLFSALQLAYGLAGKWERIIVVGSSRTDAAYQHLGNYGTLTVARDATPARYTELLNLCVESHKDVVIFTSLSDEWQLGVGYHANTSYHEDVLRAHRTFLQTIRNAPVHIIACLDTRKVFLPKDLRGRRTLNVAEQVIQQPGIEGEFMTVLHLDKKGLARVQRDDTDVFDREQRIALNVLHGCVLLDWCHSSESIESLEIQQRIDRCTTLDELYRLLFLLDVDDANLIAAFTKRRLELDSDQSRDVPTLLPIEGGLL